MKHTFVNQKTKISLNYLKLSPILVSCSLWKMADESLSICIKHLKDCACANSNLSVGINCDIAKAGQSKIMYLLHCKIKKAFFFHSHDKHSLTTDYRY